MKIQIIHRACGGTEFLPQPSRLHLGAQNAEGVDRLQFQLPESWADCAIALYLRRSDGTQLALVPLDGDACVTVDRRLTGCTGGQWMLAAVSGSGYTAYTRPGRYDTYATLPTDGGSEDLPPTLYEQFVARVLESASTAATAAQSASASAERCTSSAAQAQTAARQASTSSTAAAGCASRAEAAAARAEELAPADGQVLSVNGKSGVVVLRAQDVGALPRPAQPAAGSPAAGSEREPRHRCPAHRHYAPARPDALCAQQHPAGRKDPRPGAHRPAIRRGCAGGRHPDPCACLRRAAGQHDRRLCAAHPGPAALRREKALTTASTAAGWTGAEKTAALRTLGADLTAYYTRLEADAKFGTPYSLPPATADQLGGVKVGEALDIAPDGTLSAKTLNDKIAAAVAVKSEPRLVWNHYEETGKRWKTYDIKMPDGLDYVHVKTKYNSSTGGYGEEVDIAKGGTANHNYGNGTGIFASNTTFQTNGTLHFATESSTGGYTVEIWLTGYHYPTLADLLTQVTAVESSVTDLQVALCELYEEKEEN